MALTSAFVLFAVLWFVILLCVLPFRTPSQQEDGKIVPGTHASAPADAQIKRKFLITTLITLLLWAPLCLAIIYGFITADAFDLYRRFGPDS